MSVLMRGMILLWFLQLVACQGKGPIIKSIALETTSLLRVYLG